MFISTYYLLDLSPHLTEVKSFSPTPVIHGRGWNEGGTMGEAPLPHKAWKSQSSWSLRVMSALCGQISPFLSHLGTDLVRSHEHGEILPNFTSIAAEHAEQHGYFTQGAVATVMKKMLTWEPSANRERRSLAFAYLQPQIRLIWARKFAFPVELDLIAEASQVGRAQDRSFDVCGVSFTTNINLGGWRLQAARCMKGSPPARLLSSLLSSTHMRHLPLDVAFAICNLL